MPTPPLSAADIASRKRALFQARQEAPQRQFARASELLGIHRTTLKRWLDKERTRPQVAAPPVPAGEKPRYRVQALSRAHVEEGPIYTVVAAGDFHDKPGRCKERAKWIARHVAAVNPDHFVSIGDWASFDSLSTHEQPGSQNDADRFPFHADIESLDESLSIFHRELPVGAVPITITLGNHEWRCERAANRQPKVNGDMPLRRDEVFSRYRWQAHTFGEFVDVGGFGVDWVHIPLSIMGKEMGGEMVERNVGLKALRHTVCGHTHRANVLTVMKVGQQRQVKIVNLGTAMPDQLVERYTGLAPTGWFYGLHEIRIRDGQILSVRQLDMPLLEQLYGD